MLPSIFKCRIALEIKAVNKEKHGAKGRNGFVKLPCTRSENLWQNDTPGPGGRAERPFSVGGLWGPRLPGNQQVYARLLSAAARRFVARCGPRPRVRFQPWGGHAGRGQTRDRVDHRPDNECGHASACPSRTMCSRWLWCGPSLVMFITPFQPEFSGGPATCGTCIAVGHALRLEPPVSPVQPAALHLTPKCAVRLVVHILLGGTTRLAPCRSGEALRTYLSTRSRGWAAALPGGSPGSAARDSRGLEISRDLGSGATLGGRQGHATRHTLINKLPALRRKLADPEPEIDQVRHCLPAGRSKQGVKVDGRRTKRANSMLGDVTPEGRYIGLSRSPRPETGARRLNMKAKGHNQLLVLAFVRLKLERQSSRPERQSTQRQLAAGFQTGNQPGLGHASRGLAHQQARSVTEPASKTTIPTCRSVKRAQSPTKAAILTPYNYTGFHSEKKSNNMSTFKMRLENFDQPYAIKIHVKIT
ncbi:hypothetical protein EGW08_007258 [Elysia chlorotica]|uniref:Uncharacterized protein n=1 Tax=Elysia chlorotica TaxID=188477 RepID=A0A433TTW8_ELYCH|nr:hypothetical protein EGW08_007258 [Elysia chlorotica]